MLAGGRGEFEMKINQRNQHRIELLSEIVQSYLINNEHRIYFKPSNGKFPPGYAKTFKMVPIKKRKDKNEKIN